MDEIDSGKCIRESTEFALDDGNRKGTEEFCDILDPATWLLSSEDVTFGLDIVTGL